MGIQSAFRRVVPNQQQFNIDEFLRKQQESVPLADNDKVGGMLAPPQDLPRTVNPALPPAQPSTTANAPAAEIEYQPQQPQRTVVPADQLGKPPTAFNRNNKGRPISVAAGPEDPVERNMELIREQEGYKAPRSTKDQILAFLTGGIPGGVAYATDQNTRNRWAVGDDVAREEGQIQREQGVQSKQASIEAAKYRPVYQDRMGDIREDEAKRRQESADSLSANRDANLKIKQHDAENREPVEVDIDGQKVMASPDVAARLKATQSENAKSREARRVSTDKVLAALGTRQKVQIAASIAQLGNPQEMYAAASDLWQQATEAEKQANSIEVKTEGDVANKKQLLENAAKLKEATVKIQQEARKIPGARGRSTNQGLSRATFLTNNPQFKGKPTEEIDALITGGGYTPTP